MQGRLDADVNGNKKVVINALLDDASTTTYLNSDVAVELGLRGELQNVNVTVLNDQVETLESIPVEFKLESLGSKINTLVSRYTTMLLEI